jgi:hypothetical protein
MGCLSVNEHKNTILSMEQSKIESAKHGTAASSRRFGTPTAIAKLEGGKRIQTTQKRRARRKNFAFLRALVFFVTAFFILDFIQSPPALRAGIG